MPVTKSAKEEIRKTVGRNLRNKASRSLTKTNVVKAEKFIFSGNADEAKKAVTAAISSLDKAAEKGTIAKNNAARRKSRLVKKLNKIQSPPAAK